MSREFAVIDWMDAGDFEPPAPTLTARANTTVSHKWLFSAHVQHGCRDRLGLAVKKTPDLQGKRKKIQTKPHTCFKAGLKPPFIEKKAGLQCRVQSPSQLVTPLQ